MGARCEICGEFNSSIEVDQFSQFIKEKIASYGVAAVIDLSDTNEIKCEICGQAFCLKCFQNRQYNGKSLDNYIEIFDKKYGTLASKSYLADKYVCQTCAKIEASSKCYTCGKKINQDKEGKFSGKHVGHHVKCTNCNSLICLDCATTSENPLKYKKKCPFCGNKRWLPIKNELLFTHYLDTIIYLNERRGFACQSCGKEKTIMLFCKKELKSSICYCPDCLLVHDPKNKGYCPHCGKKGYKKYRNSLESLAKNAIELPSIDVSKAEKKTELDDKIAETLDKNEVIEEIIPEETVNPDEPNTSDEAYEEILPDKTVDDDVKHNNLTNLSHTKSLNEELTAKTIKYNSSTPETKGALEYIFDLREDLRRMVRITNLIDDLKEFIQGMSYSIQFHLKNGQDFYLQFHKGKMIGNIGKMSSPTIKSRPISEETAHHILHGIADVDFEFLQGDLEKIEHFMDFHEMFDMVVHS